MAPTAAHLAQQAQAIEAWQKLTREEQDAQRQQAVSAAMRRSSQLQPQYAVPVLDTVSPTSQHLPPILESNPDTSDTMRDDSESTYSEDSVGSFATAPRAGSISVTTPTDPSLDEAPVEHAAKEDKGKESDQNFDGLTYLNQRLQDVRMTREQRSRGKPRSSGRSIDSGRGSDTVASEEPPAVRMPRRSEEPSRYSVDMQAQYDPAIISLARMIPGERQNTRASAPSVWPLFRAKKGAKGLDAYPPWRVWDHDPTITRVRSNSAAPRMMKEKRADANAAKEAADFMERELARARGQSVAEPQPNPEPAAVAAAAQPMRRARSGSVALPVRQAADADTATAPRMSISSKRMSVASRLSLVPEDRLIQAKMLCDQLHEVQSALDALLDPEAVPVATTAPYVAEVPPPTRRSIGERVSPQHEHPSMANPGYGPGPTPAFESNGEASQRSSSQRRRSTNRPRSIVSNGGDFAANGRVSFQAPQLPTQDIDYGGWQPPNPNRLSTSSFATQQDGGSVAMASRLSRGSSYASARHPSVNWPANWAEYLGDKGAEEAEQKAQEEEEEKAEKDKHINAMLEGTSELGIAPARGSARSSLSEEGIDAFMSSHRRNSEISPLKESFSWMKKEGRRISRNERELKAYKHAQLS